MMAKFQSKLSGLVNWVQNNLFTGNMVPQKKSCLGGKRNLSPEKKYNS